MLLAARFPNGGFIPVYNTYGWTLNCFRPEEVALDSRGIAQFPASQLGGPGPWSMPWSLEAYVAPPMSGTHSVAKQQFAKQWVAMCPDPNFRSQPCPFPSDASGNPGQPGTASGSHDTYRMMVVAADIWGPLQSTAAWGIDPSVPNSLDQPVFVATGGVVVNPLGMRFLRATVANPRTATAGLASSSSFALTPSFDVLTWQSANGPMPILGIEPSLSLDGRLLLFQGNLVNNTRPWNSASTEIHQIMYTFNPTPGVPAGWSEPRPISEMFVREQNHVVDGVPFARRYPIAAAPMTMADGSALTQPLQGAYPWMTLDATDLVFSATRRGNVPGERRDRGMSIVGRSTGFIVRHIDGPLNPDRDATDRIITTGTGAVPGIWAWGGDTPNLRLPYTRLGTTIPLLQMQTREYAEISVHEMLDRDYLLAWDMNEFMLEDALLGWRLDLTRTADTSGNRITGVLSSEAKFPEDWNAASTSDTGASGQMILCTGNGSVSASSVTLAGTPMALTVECWFGRAIFNGQPYSIVRKAGSYELAGDPQGLVRATVHTAGGTVQSGWLGAPMTSDKRHVAVSYDGALGRFRVFIDGTSVLEQFVPPGAAVLASASPLLAGPAGLTIGSSAPVGWVGLDQLRISRVERTADELARAAFAVPTPSGLQTLPTSFALPLGLDRQETKVPTNNVPSPAAILLGDTLFHDTLLSGSGTVACATCHVSNQSFTDGLAQRPGFATGTPLRNAQTVLNRLFSTRQFWDGRATDLETQVLAPLFHVDEMGTNAANVLTYLNTSVSPDYVSMFQAAFAAPPSLQLLQDALASYQRALVAGDSAADRHEAGLVPLSASADRGRDLFFGKARCFGCHSGSNYSDERFHVSLIPPTSDEVPPPPVDPGRFGVTGRTRDYRRFKTPTLRNLAQTAPYFHRGQVPTLATVIEMYDAAGDGTFAVDEEVFPLGLSAAEKADLEAFLLSLSGGWIRL